MKLQDYIPSSPIDLFKVQHVLVIKFTSVKDAAENFHWPELAGEPLKSELNFNFLPELVIRLSLLVERKSLVAGHKIGVVGKKI